MTKMKNNSFLSTEEAIAIAKKYYKPNEYIEEYKIVMVKKSKDAYYIEFDIENPKNEKEKLGRRVGIMPIVKVTMDGNPSYLPVYPLSFQEYEEAKVLIQF